MSLRMEFVERAEKGEKIAGLCREFGISRTTGHKWVQRFKKGGYEGLEEESRQPKTTPLATAEEGVDGRTRGSAEATRSKVAHKLQVVLRRKLGEATPSERTIARILRRAELVRVRRVRRRPSVVERPTPGGPQRCSDIFDGRLQGLVAFARRQAVRPAHRARRVQPLCVVDSDLSDDHSRRTQGLRATVRTLRCPRRHPVRQRDAVRECALARRYFGPFCVVDVARHPARAFTPRQAAGQWRPRAYARGRRCGGAKCASRNARRATASAGPVAPAVQHRAAARRASGQDARGGVQADRASQGRGARVRVPTSLGGGASAECRNVRLARSKLPARVTFSRQEGGHRVGGHASRTGVVSRGSTWA